MIALFSYNRLQEYMFADRCLVVTSQNPVGVYDCNRVCVDKEFRDHVPWIRTICAEIGKFKNVEYSSAQYARANHKPREMTKAWGCPSIAKCNRE